MNKKNIYKQYFTPNKLAEFMTSIVPSDDIKTIIDLSMGECCLLDEAKKRWDKAQFFGVDIDSELLENIRKSNTYINIFEGDSLSDKINEWPEYKNIINKEGFDLAIANPPFNFYDKKYVEVDKNFSLSLPVEIRFLLKYIEIIKENGYICTILPYGFLSLDCYYDIRNILFEKIKIHKVIKIFKSCFNKIYADTCILLIQKKKEENIQKNLKIEYLDSNYKLKEFGYIQTNSERLDLEYSNLTKYLNFIEKNTKFDVLSIENYTLELKRGKTLTKNKELLSKKGVRFLHTTDLKKLFISDKKPNFIRKDSNYFSNSIVKKDDILIARVGTACIGKVGVVTSKYKKSVISDCILSLRVKNIDPYYVALYLGTDLGQKQLKYISKGSCSKYITKKDLMNVKIVEIPMELQLYFRKKYFNIIVRSKEKNKKCFLEELIEELERFLKKE